MENSDFNEMFGDPMSLMSLGNLGNLALRDGLDCITTWDVHW